MSDEDSRDSGNKDAFADAFSAVLIVLIPVITVIYWLSGLPVS